MRFCDLGSRFKPQPQSQSQSQSFSQSLIRSLFAIVRLVVYLKTFRRFAGNFLGPKFDVCLSAYLSIFVCATVCVGVCGCMWACVIIMCCESKREAEIERWRGRQLVTKKTLKKLLTGSCLWQNSCQSQENPRKFLLPSS